MTKHYAHIITFMLVVVCVTACGSTSPTATLAPTPGMTDTVLPVAWPTELVSTPTPMPPTVAPPTAPVTTETSLTATVAPTTEPAATETALPVTAVPSGPPTMSEPTAGTRIVGTVVRFSARSTSVDVTIGENNPAVRDFLAMLPLTLTLEELVDREKIAYLPRPLAHAGSPGTDPEDGDLIYYIPWGNLGFYYNAAGIEYSDQTIHIGTYQASRAQIDQLEGEDVTVEVVR